MIHISKNLIIKEDEVQLSSIRAQGSGGQNVNKVSSAIHLRFDIQSSSLTDSLKLKLLASNDHRISSDGIIIIKAQNFRTREKNKQDALARLKELIQQTNTVRKKRLPTKATRGSQTRRLNSKTKHGKTKSLRKKVFD